MMNNNSTLVIAPKWYFVMSTTEYDKHDVADEMEYTFPVAEKEAGCIYRGDFIGVRRLVGPAMLDPNSILTAEVTSQPVYDSKKKKLSFKAKRIH